ncbi:MAG TPA: DUF116 domain-containing protein [Methylomusa anaerophila]|uniref:DUF116 domain-containing protein n=1 Tax=Methylomusa anaerophila TaxID=1930071 RepID=A0A348APN2_9FIRM|nr:DUF116 domain-containing protein [Methylomusa anaerophila]BBB93030.1 hypothetical protein MAMMFC1_03739 [Methylomusa anaerophila]HML87136.1 DUF116 domain-containing protein [Methylomusa anaerophila]
MIEAVPRPKKRLFLTLILLSLFLAALSTYGLWIVSSPGLSNISAYLPLILGTLLAVAILAIASGVVGIILAILGFPTLGIFQGLAWSAINLLFPLAIRIGKVFEVDKERVERSFIEVSNHLVLKKQIKVTPDRLLLLTPHCIQQETCPHKITRNVANCHHCGQCQVGDLSEMAKSYGVNLAVVTGGTLARKIIKSLRPKAVLAIACERDLTSGIQDVFPLPVIGVLNERPYGPCCNTRVDLKKVEKAIQSFLAEKQ